MRLVHERDLMRELLDLHDEVEMEPFLERVLGLARGATGATVAYMAIGPGFASSSPQWWRAHALDDAAVADVRERISTTLLRVTSDDGFVHTVDAGSDPRFRDTPSVQAHRIRAVLCAALRTPQGSPIGALYLADPAERGPFDASALKLTPLLARHLGPIAQRLLLARRGELVDPTRVHRGQLAAKQLVGQSEGMARVLEALVAASAAPVPVLLCGPTGTGKTTIARVLHDSGPDANEPFVAVNAAQLRPDLAAAELFGARRGAYTGLDHHRGGLVEESEGGTLFLDEVGELDPSVQAQLLTFLQDGTFRRLGETQTRRVRKVRVVSATNRELAEAVDAGTFREDLMYRLAAFRIDVPALAQRPEDIVPLAFALTDRIARQYDMRSRPLSAGACAWLESQPWPGNIRELENAVRAGLLWANAEDAAAIRVEHLDRQAQAVPPPARDLKTAVAQFKRRFAERAVRDADGNKSEAARRLGIHRTSLHELLRS